MSENQPYIGAPVTLISSLDVRYEGTLFTIDPNESTVALKNVRCLGTEGRQQGQKAIPPSDAVYEFIIFRGENIKNINIIAEEKFNKRENELSDPSILKIGPKGSAESKRDQRRNRGDGGNMPPFYDRQYRRDPAKYRPRRQDPRQGGYGMRGGYRRDQRRPYPPRGYDQYDRRGNDRRYDNRRVRNNRRNQNRDRRGPDNQRSQVPRANPGDAKFLTGRDAKEEKISMSEDFDFEKATFDKTNVLEVKEKPATDEPAATAEQKDEEATTTTEEKAEAGTTPETGDKTEETGEKASEPAEKGSEVASYWKGVIRKNMPSDATDSDGNPKTTDDTEEQKEESPEPAEPAPKPFEYTYDPSNFFDDLDLADRSTMDFKARRKIDAQTFGEEASNYKVRRRRRRGGSNRRRRPRYNNRY